VDGIHKSGFTRLETGVLMVAVLAYFGISCAIAQVRLFWYDEIFTRQVMQLGEWSRIVAALHHGIDLQPPFFYFISGWSRYLGGEEIGMRLPAMLGFTFAGFSLYLIARRWFSPGYAMGVALTPPILFFGALGMEARPYGFVLGCSSLALFGWTFRDRKPLAGNAGYVIGILGAASAHYYGFMIAAPFGAAAAWTLFRKRRWDLGTLFGCVCAALPDLWNMHLIREGIAIYRNGAWNPPSWRVLGNSLYGWSLAVLGAVLLVNVVSGISGNTEASQEESPPGEQLACWAGFSAIPILAMFMARAFSGMFTLRYFSMYSLGYGLLLAYLLHQSAKGSRMAGYVAGCGALIAFGSVAWASEQHFETEREVASTSCGHFTGLMDQPEFRHSSFLIGDAHVALQLAVYCEDLRDRIVFGPDPVRSLAYAGNDTAQKAMLLLRESPPMRIVPLDEFLRGEQRALLVYHSKYSFLKDYFSHEPEYAARLHILEEGLTYAVYRLDPAPQPGGGEK
jgi:hypothetical protein